MTIPHPATLIKIVTTAQFPTVIGNPTPVPDLPHEANPAFKISLRMVSNAKDKTKYARITLRKVKDFINLQFIWLSQRFLAIIFA